MMNLIGFMKCIPIAVLASRLATQKPMTRSPPNTRFDFQSARSCRHRFNNQWYFTAGLNDANGTITDDLDFFKGGAEFFMWFEFGWSPGKDNRYFKNVHITTWHVDDRDVAGIDSGKDVMFATNWLFGDRFMPYARLGWSDGAEQNMIYDRSATLGFIWKYMRRSDVAGLAINWGSPPDSSLRDQTTIEGFWRFQFAQNFEITPSLQLLFDPALNPNESKLWLLGLRMRLTFQAHGFG